MRSLACLILLVTACSPPVDVCANLICGVGQTCDPRSGLCVRIDAGNVTDSGTEDAGVPDGGGQGGGGGGGGCTPACTGSDKCDPSSGRCVQCLDDRDCSCPAFRCVNNFCTTPAMDPDAGPLMVTPPQAESCTSAQPFSFLGCTVPRSFQFRTNLGVVMDNEQGVCSAAQGGGRDLVYVLTLEATYDLTVTVTPVNGSGAHPIVYVRRMPCAGQELACVNGGGPFQTTVHLRSRTAGDYAIFLDTLDAASGGEVEVTVTLSAPTQPSNDTCLTADPLPADGGSVRADTSIASNDEFTSCNSAGGPELVWRLVLDRPSDIVARAVAADAGVSAFIQLREGDCASGPSRGCAGSGTGGVAALRARGVDAGVYYLIVESPAVAAGAVDVSAQIQEPSPPLQHDTCAAPYDIVFADGGTFVELDVDTSTASDDHDGTCNDPAGSGAGGPEYVYRLRLLSPRRVAVTASRAPGGTADPVLYMRSGSCTGTNEVGCSDDPLDSSTTEQLTSGTNTLPPGDYFIFVESYGASVGPTHLTVSATP